ncbi:4Fe-4S dicluster domain-containing protein [Vibrio celticus]|uniref:Electron transport complex protein RnfC n=1 Tax=Vibrio celticus TaxID=446372 RepID=A0A1C3JEE8_9VIBR|nr:4Fe-4S dicluster domain-containing protein [Vibrio celticus]SBT13503.1 Electron transport complex protein RnfC [Vibrio celticus]
MKNPECVIKSHLTQLDKNTIVERVKQAGVVGAGGAGFPTYVKLQSEAEIFLVNAAECEPMLKVDQQLMAEKSAELIRGLTYAMKATGAKEGVIALKAKYQKAIDALTPLLAANMRIHILRDVYPAGDEVITIWLATGRRVAPAQLPITVGVIVNNVQTLINVCHAVEHEQGVFDRTLTINGCVNNPMTITVPIGVTFQELLDYAGGVTESEFAVINGGPMMGALVEDLNQCVTKTTGALLVLPRDHIIIQRRLKSDQQILNMAKTVCEQCSLCTELCPRHLIGHELAPSQVIRATNYKDLAQPSTFLSALTCSECSLCESYACPVNISPMRVNKILKKQLRAQGAQYCGELKDADPMAEYRLVPTARLVSRLNLTPYYQEALMQPFDLPYRQVKVAISQHIGAPGEPIVQAGDRVTLGQKLTEAKANALSLGVHASCNGTVSEIDAQYITIQRGR